MKKITTLGLSLLLLAGSSLNAFAQGPDQPPEKRPQQQQQNHNQQPGHGQQALEGRNEPHQQAHRQTQQSQQPDFRKGRPLPSQYRGAGYQVSDWKKHGLKAPPAGHRWQNVNGNYVLIAVATGVIASVIAHP